MRDGFREIIYGWESDEAAQVEDRIRRAALWLRDNQPPQEDEAAALSAIIEGGITRTTSEIVGAYLRRAGISLDDHEERYRAIIHGKQPPEQAAFAAGYAAHAAGKPFGRPDVDHHTVAALSWRIGWNQRALDQAGSTDGEGLNRRDRG